MKLRFFIACISVFFWNPLLSGDRPVSESRPEIVIPSAVNEPAGFAESEALPTVEEVREGILRAATAFSSISCKGGYPFMVSADLKTRYNAGHGTKGIFPDETCITIEAPGTPRVGQSFLRAYRATGDRRLLNMAMETGDAMATVQLACGGWRMRQPLSDAWADSHKPAHISSQCFYPSPPQADFDDSRTQGSILFLIELVRDGSDSERHKAALKKGLDLLLEAQYPSGGWPQYYPLVLKDGYSILNNYRRNNHINDNSIADCMRVLLAAWQTFGGQEHLDALLRAAGWLLEVRVPGAGWAQQYYDDFIKGPQKPNSPAPGRWFEPVAIATSETPGVLEILTEVWLATGDDRYVEPFEEVAGWLRRVQLDEGTWARFYEIHTNRPLYCTPDSVITYSDENLRPGYGWKGPYGNRAFRIVSDVKEKGRAGILAERNGVPGDEKLRQLGLLAREALDALDERNFWVETRTDAAEKPLTSYIAAEDYGGTAREFISCGLFNQRMDQLSAYLEAVSKRNVVK